MARNNSGNCVLLSRDLMHAILLELPVKSLLRFKSVCKFWNVVITSSSFISEHLNNERNRSHLIVHFDNTTAEPYIIEIFSDEELEDLSHQHFDIPTQFYRFYGPCNGIFCLSSPTFGDYDSCVSLWNPATKELKYLPPPLGKPSLPFEYDYYLDEYGFGLDLITHKYKVVIIRRFCGEDYAPLKQIMMHTFDSEFWKELRLSKDYDFDVSPFYTYLDGVYYWAASCYEEEEKMIIAFNMSTDTFEEIQVPFGYSFYNHTLAVCQDSLTLFLSNDLGQNTTNFDAWIMRGKGRWSKQFTIGPLLDIHRPIGSLKSNQIILQSTTEQLFLCDPATQEIKDIEFQGYIMCVGTFIYKESLVSLDYENEQLNIEDR